MKLYMGNYLLDRNQYFDAKKFINEQSELDNNFQEISDETINEGLGDWLSNRKMDAFKIVLSEQTQELALLNEKIHDSMKVIETKCDYIQKKARKSKKPMDIEFAKSLDKTLSEIDNTTFDILAIIGKLNLSFVRFCSRIAGTNLVDTSLLFMPVRNIQMIRTAYNLFVAYVKRDLQKYIYLLNINFAQFQVQIMKIADAADNGLYQLEAALNDLQGSLRERSKKILKDDTSAQIKADREFRSLIEEKRKMYKEQYGGANSAWDSFYGDIFQNMANELKQGNQEACQQEIESLKQLLQNIAKQNTHLQPYASLLENAASASAAAINQTMASNFLKLSAVFKTTNQKAIGDAIKEATQARNRQYNNELLKDQDKENKKKQEKLIEQGKVIFEKIVKTRKDERLKKWYKMSNEDINLMNTYMKSEYDKSKSFIDTHKLFVQSPMFKLLVDEKSLLSRCGLLQDFFSSGKGFDDIKTMEDLKDVYKKMYEFFCDEGAIYILCHVLKDYGLSYISPDDFITKYGSSVRRIFESKGYIFRKLLNESDEGDSTSFDSHNNERENKRREEEMKEVQEKRNEDFERDVRVIVKALNAWERDIEKASGSSNRY